ncbi:OmpP1/FadL family transporter [Aquimarina sp. W85]|uniref:OmpP1/FadL family transporter n=1 Tax=Aquimarina rhodophyticola TaxID=3342246 RepID=UPI00366D34E6
MINKSLFFIAILVTAFSNAQDITDAVRFSNQELQGTARFRAMSGAFGALGADLSALQINPAGSAVFLNSSASVTISSQRIENEAAYFNTLNTSAQRDLNFNQLGAVFVYNNLDENFPINRFSIGLAYDQTASNANEFFVSGTSQNSIDSYFLSKAQGIQVAALTVQPRESVEGVYSFLGETEGDRAQQAFLGYESFIIEAVDPDEPTSSRYISNIANGPEGFDQTYSNESTGLNGKFTLNGGLQLHKNFYLGVNLSSHFINYDRVTRFYEFNNNTGSRINEIRFNNRLSTNGAGFSAQIGGIAKLSNQLRVGLALESPTWYYITEETLQEIETNSNEEGRAVVRPNVVNVFPEYQLKTPAKATGSVAWLFGNKGLLSLDYSYKDYSTTEFDSEEGVQYNQLNQDIQNTLQGASSVRVGGEWRNGNWSFRGGLRFEESPYKDDRILSEKEGYSLGLGYTFRKIRLDAAYDYTSQNRSQQLFSGSDFINQTTIDTTEEQLTFTVSFNL